MNFFEFKYSFSDFRYFRNWEICIDWWVMRFFHNLFSNLIFCQSHARRSGPSESSTAQSPELPFKQERPMIDEIYRLTGAKTAGIYTPALLEQLRNAIQDVGEVRSTVDETILSIAQNFNPQKDVCKSLTPWSIPVSISLMHDAILVFQYNCLHNAYLLIISIGRCYLLMWVDA